MAPFYATSSAGSQDRRLDKFLRFWFLAPSFVFGSAAQGVIFVGRSQELCSECLKGSVPPV